MIHIPTRLVLLLLILSKERVVSATTTGAFGHDEIIKNAAIRSSSPEKRERQSLVQKLSANDMRRKRTTDNNNNHKTTTTTTNNDNRKNSNNGLLLRGERKLIVGGTAASEDEFPWFVSPIGNGFCGGSLVAPNVVLTAAHCDTSFTLGSTVLIGSIDRGSPSDGAVARTLIRRVMHPLYNQTSDEFAYDLLLLELSSPVTTIEPVAWNMNSNIPTAGTSVTVMGFGRTAFETGPVQFDLLKVDLEIMSDSQCLRRYGSNNLSPDIMLCAIGTGDSVGGSACQGDSGGPLVMQAMNTTTGSTYALQVGVVSWGVRCGNTFFPGVYARPSGAVPWMEATICALSPDCDGTLQPTIAPVFMPTTSNTPSPIEFIPPSGPQPPTPFPIISTPTVAPTYAQSCVCLAGAQGCLQNLCRLVSIQIKCEELGCTWLSGGSTPPPPDVEEPPTNNDDDMGGIFKVDADSSSDAEKAIFSLLMGLGATVVTFCLLAGMAAMCFGCQDKKREQQGNVTPNRQQQQQQSRDPQSTRRSSNSQKQRNRPTGGTNNVVVLGGSSSSSSGNGQEDTYVMQTDPSSSNTDNSSYDVR